MQDYKRKNHEVPRLLMGDAYTIGSNEIESEKAKDESVYYITARRFLDKINTDLYTKEDTRYILSGFGRIIDYLLFKPISALLMGLTFADVGGLPTNTETWTYFCEQMLSGCDELHVLMLDGWEKSGGVAAEIEVAKNLGIEIKYVNQ